MNAFVLDCFARSTGFADGEEMRAMLLRVPLRTPVQRTAYERWADRDGTKAGLLQLLDAPQR